MPKRLLSRVARCGVCLVWLAGSACAAVSAQEPPAAQPPEAEILTMPIVLDGIELFRVRGVSSYPADARARLIQSQIAMVAADAALAPDSVRIVESGGTTRIMAGSVPIMTVVEADANLEQVSRNDLASTHRLRIQQAISRYRDARTTTALRDGAVRSLIATLLLLVALVALRPTWRGIDRLLRDRLRPSIQAVEARSFELLRAEHVWTAVRHVLLAFRLTVVAGLGLVYLGYILAQFPWTKPRSQDVIALAVDPLRVMATGFVSHIPSLVFLAVLFVLVRLWLRIMRLFFDAVGRGAVPVEGFDPDWATPTYKLTRLAVVAFALIVAYPYIPGSSTAAFQGVSLFVGIVFSLGSTAAISNMVAGYMMTYRRALKVGDRVRIGSTVGDVIETRLQVTHLRSVKNEEIIIPNSQILAGEVVNYSSLARTSGLILHTEVGIGYDGRGGEGQAGRPAGRADRRLRGEAGQAGDHPQVVQVAARTPRDHLP